MAEPLCKEGSEEFFSFLFYRFYQLFFVRASSCTFDLPPFLRSSTLIPVLFVRRAKKRMYFSSIHCAVVMTTTILDNLPPLRTCPPLYQAILFLISTRPRFLTVKSVYTGWKYHKYHPINHRYRDNYGEIWIL